MALIHNQTFRLLDNSAKSGFPAGLYRVIFDEPGIGKTTIVCIQPSEPGKRNGGGRKKLQTTKKPRKKAPSALVGELIWAERNELQDLQDALLLLPIEIQREAIYAKALESQKDKDNHEQRCRVMAAFLDIERLKEGILLHGGMGGLVREAMATFQASRSYIYKLWSLLCRHGLSTISLRPRLDRCGARNVLRPCDPGGRKKAGNKTKEQKIAKILGINLEPKQPGMSTSWRMAIMAADRAIKGAVKPADRSRYTQILQTSFVRKYRQVGNVLVPVELNMGEYPTRQQVQRVLSVEIPKLARLLEKTTLGHFQRNLRGLVARNWKGVAGPGHTWAIDSTIGDIYLRSSLNRAWIVGRPIVYVVVDIWSTAIVGFYVCLTGPSWNTAKISLFNSAADPSLVGEMWGYEPVLSLNPAPTMCYQLMCDRGEYLSKGANQTAIKLIPSMAYAPPYRPDLKGLVEVLHRIEKDQQFMFIPGAMDARRAEFDLRKSNPEQSALTVREYVQVLHLIFSEYNLTADRSKRVDAHMAAAGVFPSPSGLWRWGHLMGIGLHRAIPQNDLITTLLAPGTATVGRSSVTFAGNDYESKVINAEQWTTTARNFGSWKIPVFSYPGSVGRIWTPHTGGEGLIDLRISDQAKTSAEVTYDELSDSIAYVQLQRNDIEHQRTLHALQKLRQLEEIKEKAVQLTAQAMSKVRGTNPTMTEARILEVAHQPGSSRSETRATQETAEDAMQAHEEMMRAFLDAANTEEDKDA